MGDKQAEALMSGSTQILKTIQATSKAAADLSNEARSDLAQLMADADYLRQSSALINEALQKGFDVLQLSNGDIVTTGTKTIVNTYTWDKNGHKLSKLKTAKKEQRAKKDEFIDETLDD